jgi:hypothetical protein
MPPKIDPRLKKQLISFKIDPAILRGLQFVQERDGVLVSEQLRRGALLYLESKGVKIPRQKKGAKSV